MDEEVRQDRRHRSYAEYRASNEIVTKRGGIFWGIVLLIVGIVWLLGSLGYFELNVDILLPMLVIILGVYLIVTKAAR
jgi:apolipoprotein N-acyltransferase